MCVYVREREREREKGENEKERERFTRSQHTFQARNESRSTTVGC